MKREILARKFKVQLSGPSFCFIAEKHWIPSRSCRRSDGRTDVLQQPSGIIRIRKKGIRERGCCCSDFSKPIAAELQLKMQLCCCSGDRCDFWSLVPIIPRQSTSNCHRRNIFVIKFRLVQTYFSVLSFLSSCRCFSTPCDCFADKDFCEK